MPTPHLRLSRTCVLPLLVWLPTPAAAWQSIETSTQLTAGDAESAGLFGTALAVSGSTVLISAPWGEHSGVVGAGVVHLLERNQGGPGSWAEAGRLTASDPGSYEGFGFALALDGGTAAVGSPRDDLAAGMSAGSAYVFERDQGGPGAWGQVAKLTAADPDADDDFGNAVALSVDTLAAGAWAADIDGLNDGAVYLFERDQGGAGAWGQAIRIDASDGGDGDLFGGALAIEGDTLAVAALGSDAVYVFERNQGGPGAWGEVAKLISSSPQSSSGFGSALSLQQDTLVIGARSDKVAGLSTAGAAYVFERDPGGAAWTEVQQLTASDPAVNTQFGISLDRSGDRIVVGAFWADNVYEYAGAAYVFERDPLGAQTWTEVAKLTRSAPMQSDFFGTAAALAGTTILVGAPQDEEGYALDKVKSLACDPGTGALFGVEDIPFPPFQAPGERLLALDPLAGAGAPIGFTGFDRIKGLAFDPLASQLFGADTSTDQLLLIDPVSGATQVVGALGFGEVEGLAYDPLTGTLYGADSGLDALITIDTVTGLGTLVGPFGLAGLHNVTGLAFDPGTSTLFGSNVAGDQLLTIDPVTGAASVVGPLGFGQVAGLTFDPSSDTLFGVDADTGQLLAIDPATGAATVVGPLSTTVFETGSVTVFDDYLPSETFCTAGTSAGGCQALIGAAGTASASASSGFFLSVQAVEGDKDGLFFYGTGGRQANSWGSGTSYVCVVPPRARGGLLTAQGSLPGTCDGGFTQDLNARWCASCPKPNHNPGAGALLQAQFWYRDPQNTSNQTSSLSDAIEVLVGP